MDRSRWLPCPTMYKCMGTTTMHFPSPISLFPHCSWSTFSLFWTVWLQAHWFSSWTSTIPPHSHQEEDRWWVDLGNLGGKERKMMRSEEHYAILNEFLEVSFDWYQLMGKWCGLISLVRHQLLAKCWLLREMIWSCCKRSSVEVSNDLFLMVLMCFPACIFSLFLNNLPFSFMLHKHFANKNDSTSLSLECFEGEEDKVAIAGEYHVAVGHLLQHRWLHSGMFAPFLDWFWGNERGLLWMCALQPPVWILCNCVHVWCCSCDATLLVAMVCSLLPILRPAQFCEALGVLAEGIVSNKIYIVLIIFLFLLQFPFLFHACHPAKYSFLLRVAQSLKEGK